MNNINKKPLLEVRGLVKYFSSGRPSWLSRQGKSVVRAVDGLNFSIGKGETVGLVGESGCGKSTTGRLILRLLDPTSGEICFEGKSITNLGYREMRPLRQNMQIIFQDPFMSLDPQMKVGEIIGEAIEIHGLAKGNKKREMIADLLKLVGLSPEYAGRAPHEFSGGQRQRIGIARALALRPKLIVCDEPVSALDVSIQAQVINLLIDLQNEFGLTYLFIAHDLSVVKHISDRIAVMYLGKIVELVDKKRLYTEPKHPYTKALLSAVPIPDPDLKRERILLQGDIPNPIELPSGCRFHSRCQKRRSKCESEEPELLNSGNGHYVACHFADQS